MDQASSHLQLATLIHKLFQANQSADRQIYQHELETLGKSLRYFCYPTFVDHFPNTDSHLALL